MPHLQHAVELRQRLFHADMIASAALAALERAAAIPCCCWISITACCMPTPPERLCLAKADGLGASHGVVHGATQAWTQPVACGAGACGGHGRQPGAGRCAAPAAACRWRRAGTAGHAVPPGDALVAGPPANDPGFRRRSGRGRRSAGPAAGRVVRLTGSEAALAADLLAGLELREIAQRRGRSINTVRTHLGGLMTKTNVNRQSELMRLLASLPPVRDLI